MRFLRKVGNFIGKASDKTVSAGEKVTNTIKNIIATKLKFSFLAPIFIPLISIILVFLVISSMFGEKLNLMQMVDSNNGSEISSKNCSTTSDWGQALVDKARERIGTPYCSSVHNPPSDGSQGFGCAMFVAWVYNQVFFNGEDKFSGDSQAFWNNVTKQNYTTNESFVEVSAEEAQPGDVVVYTGCEGSYSCAGHVALYIGNGRIIGSWGVSGGNYKCCGCSPGVEEGTVESQAAGKAIHYLHYTNASSNGVTTCEEDGVAINGVNANSILTNDQRRKIVAAAKSQLGMPYSHANNTSSGFDCNGLASYAYGEAGITTFRDGTSDGLTLSSSWSCKQLEHIIRTEEKDLLPGDIIGWSCEYSGCENLDALGIRGGMCVPGYGGTGRHIAIYIGDGQLIHADGSSVSQMGLHDWGGYWIAGPLV